MRFSSSLTVLLSFSGATIAAPLMERASSTSAAVLTIETYDKFQVSDGVAGNALAEVNAQFPVSLLLVHFLPWPHFLIRP